MPGLKLFCDVCKRPVDHIEENYVIFTRRYEFAAFCHGEVEVTYLSDVEIEEATKIEVLHAFCNVDAQFPGRSFRMRAADSPLQRFILDAFRYRLPNR